MAGLEGEVRIWSGFPKLIGLPTGVEDLPLTPKASYRLSKKALVALRHGEIPIPEGRFECRCHVHRPKGWWLRERLSAAAGEGVTRVCAGCHAQPVPLASRERLAQGGLDRHERGVPLVSIPPAWVIVQAVRVHTGMQIAAFEHVL